MIALSRKNLVIFGAVVAVLLIGVGALYFVTKNGGTKEEPPVELTYWGVFDSPDVIQPIIDKYEAENPHVNISYEQKDIATYEEDLRNAFAEGTAPDIFTLQHMQVPKYELLIEPLPEEETSKIDEYFDVVEQDVLLNNRIYGLPYSVDSLALYYNKKMFQDAGITNPPRTWEEFNEAVADLTELDSAGTFLQNGAALGGSTTRINRATDILAFFMMQEGADMTSREDGATLFDQSIPSKEAGTTAKEPVLEGLTKYLAYSKPTEGEYTWNENQNYSFDRFAQEKLGMLFGYSYALPIVRSKNPRMDFGIVPAPQMKDATTRVSYAAYWVETVSRESENIETAWDFVKFATNKENVKLYSTATNKPGSRRDLVNEQMNDSDLAVFVEQNLYAESWYQYDGHETEVILDTMLRNIITGVETKELALQDAATKIQDIFTKAKKLKEQVEREAAEVQAEEAAAELKKQNEQAK